MTKDNAIELMKACLIKHLDQEGYMTFEAHISAHIEFIETLQYKEAMLHAKKEGAYNEHDFEVNKKAMINALKMIQDMAKLHNVTGLRLKIDYKDFSDEQ